MAIRLVAEAPCLLRHFPLASTLHIVPSLSHVALYTGNNFLKEYILRFLKLAPFKNLKKVNEYSLHNPSQAFFQNMCHTHG